MEFHISRSIRERLSLDDLLFSFTGNVVFANVAASRKLAQTLASLQDTTAKDSDPLNAGALFAMGLIDELSHALVARYRQDVDPKVITDAITWLDSQQTPAEVDRLLLEFAEQFPVVSVYRNKITATKWLKEKTEGLPNREIAFEEMLLLWLANQNPAFTPFQLLFGDEDLRKKTVYQGATSSLPTFFTTRPPVKSGLGTLLEALQAPMLASPDSITGQLEFIRENWSDVLGEELRSVLLAIDVLREEEVAIWMRFHPAGPDNHRHGAPGFGGEGFVGDEFVGFESEYVTGPDGIRRRRYAVDYQAPLVEYEAFSADQAWMPNVVLIAKSTYVWLEQLSKKYKRHIHRLDQIPDEELQLLSARGITGLWLIGLWERSRASRTIKRLRGNADAVASAYSLKDYAIAEDLGGEAAYEHLRDRAGAAGLRLASDMVPNHMGIDSDWVIENPEWFLSRWESPFPSYTFEGPDLSTDSRVEIKLEDHYYDQTDAAVAFRVRHHRDGTTRYMYHGNDGTTFAWNDTAQLDYSKADVREHVMQVILNVARRFPIIRFDAAMVLAKRHVQRLWFPLPGAGGSIPSRAEDAISEEAFETLMPHEFWREVVDRVAQEVPGTLLLAEAFWLLEGYFVRTLGMHRVYNSAFMNMLRDEENAKYRSYLIKTLEFDPDILKRYVNFMSNPDEKTAMEQFGSGDKFFGVSVLLVTLPGLPMFGHGQVEGYTERYGMDFKQARMDESPNEGLVARHQQLIAPLLKNRQLFAESTNFVMYDFWNDHGSVDENVFAYSNRSGDQRGVVFYNNTYGSTHGTIHMSVGFLEKASGALQRRSLSEGLALWDDSLVLAYRDSVVGLEYLRRASTIRHQGITLGLRGYQHVVLLDWRELWSSAEQPWDQLCDSLNGTGVYSVDEALSQLRLRPVHDKLREAVSAFYVGVFLDKSEQAAKDVSVATDAPMPEPVKKLPSRDSIEPRDVPEAVNADATFVEDPADITLSPELQDFLKAVSRFTETASNMMPQQLEAEAITTKMVASNDKPSSDTQVGRRLHVTPDGHERLPLAKPRWRPLDANAIAGALSVPFLVEKFSATGADPIALLPGKERAIAEKTWPQVIAWLALRGFPTLDNALRVFDELRLRAALAESFSSMGLEGESGWRAAARVRVLLIAGEEASPVRALTSAKFWTDADVRWLLGCDAGYFNKEKFVELVWWLQLPSLFKISGERLLANIALQEISTEVEVLTQRAHHAEYKVDKFLEENKTK